MTTARKGTEKRSVNTRMRTFSPRQWTAVFTCTMASFCILIPLNIYNQNHYLASVFQQNVINPVESSNTEDKVLAITHNFSDEIHFFVQHVPRARGCGGCDVLDELIQNLKELGFNAQGIHIGLCPDPKIIERTVPLNRSLVIVHPEIVRFNCSHLFPNRTTVTVRWILAPLGVNSGPLSELNYHRNDLIFSYNPNMIEATEHWYSNTLEVWKNPYPGDESDISDEIFYNKNRSGILWTMRKGKKFHSNITYIHEHPDIPATNIERERPINVTELVKYEYFVSYDPATYLTVLAAMSGTVSIVYPVAGLTKEQWLLRSFLGPYLHETGRTAIPGVAYGWNESEILFSRRSMHHLRPFMMDMKRWGKETTVARFARDCYRYTNGIRTNFEAGLLAKDAYPSFFKQRP